MMMKFRIKPSRRMVLKRSARACSGCRCRKVKCDVTTRGSPCTPCQIYDIPCSLPVDRRGKLAKAAEKQNAEEIPSGNDNINVFHLIGSVGKCWRPIKISQRKMNPTDN